MKHRKSICENLEERVLDFVQERKLLSAKDRVLAGVSGGADSVCLLFMLFFLRKQMWGKLRVEVVHVHHMIRGKEADEDMAYVEKLCAQYEIPFHGVCIPVQHIAKEQGLSLEEAGRKARYDTFHRICQERGLNKIAVAHHKDDQAETVLMNLLRGTGLKGAAGIPAKRNGIVRPLLCLSRKEIETYLQEKAVEYRTDSSNLDCVYTRNKIRNQVFPYLKEQINPKALEHLVLFSHQAEEIEDYFNNQANILLDEYGKLEKKRVILSLECRKEPKILRTYIIRMCLEKIGTGLKDVSAVHIEQIHQLMDGRTGAKVQLPRGIWVEKNYGEVIFFLEEPKEKGQEVIEVRLEDLQENESYVVPYEDGFFDFQVKNVNFFQTFPKKKYTKWFDYDTIKFVLQLRTRKPGDFLVINAAGGRKKLKDYFMDAKISRQDREHKILLTEGSEVLWIVGERMSEKYKVQKETKKVLEVTYYKEFSGGYYAE